MEDRTERKIESQEVSAGEVILSVKDLTTHYITREIGTCEAVRNVSFEICRGETLGLVGETGAGKSIVIDAISAVLGERTSRELIRRQGWSAVNIRSAKIISGEILWQGRDVRKVSDREMRKIRGGEISMVFQDPMTALNPIDPVGDQIAEVIYLHQKVSRAEAKKRAGDMLEVVGIPRERFGEYPHQFSGGMKQRVIIAMALACNPKLLIADEPTTALDVTIQAQVLRMMNGLKEQNGTAVLLITHDLGVIAEMCQKVAVIYAGEIVELGTAEDIFDRTAHPYTIGLFESLPSVASGTRLIPIPGMMPDPSNLPAGCKFAERCKFASDECREAEVALTETSPGHYCRCIHKQGREK